MNFDESEKINNDYLSERVDPLFRKLVKDILREKPFDIVKSFDITNIDAIFDKLV